MSVLFLCISFGKEAETAYVGSLTKRSFNPCWGGRGRGGDDIIFFIFRVFKKIMSFFITINYFRMLRTGRNNKVFSPRILVKWYQT